MENNKIAVILNEITTIQKKIKSFRPLNKELQQTLQEKLRIEWTYNSNAIEGNTLTLGETAFFLREGLTSEGKPLKDYLEAKNHAEAIDYLKDIVKRKRNLTESLIKELHALLMKDIEFTYAKGANGQIIKKPLYPGKYKMRPNHVLTLSGKIHYYTDPVHVHDEMEKLLKWFHSEKKLHIIQKAAIFHYRFAAIHPFDDGNGRLGRLLMNLIIMQRGFAPCIIKNEHRRLYLGALEESDITKDYTPFVKFICDELLTTLNTILNILRGGEEEKIVLTSARLNQFEREEMILKNISSKPVSIGQLTEKMPQIKRPTLKSDLKRLVKKHAVKVKGVKKGVLYYR